MERKIYFIIPVILLFGITKIVASNRIGIYEAYIGNRMDEWKAIIDKMEKEKKNDTDFVLELVNYQYGYIGYCLGNKKDDLAKKYLELAENNLEWLENKISSSIINAYKSAFLGYRIGLSPVKAPFLGSKSINCSKLSMEQDKENPLGYIQYGNAQFYMPPVFGGSKKEALEFFQKAQFLMEKDKKNMENDWNYLSLLTLIAQSYEKMELLKEARKYYEKALQIEPRFLWVKNELYPALLKKIEDKNE